MDTVVGAVEFGALALLPGVWFACGLPVCSLPFSAKLCIGAFLSPLILIIEFYVVRLLGVPFGLTPHLLAVLNLPAVVLVARRVGTPRFGDWKVIGGWGFILLVPLACLAPTLLNPQTRIYTGHAWMYSDPIYMLARGDLVLEDPEVAGLRLGYPWGGLLYQGLLSYVLQSPPAASYIWTNIVSLIFIAGICAAFVGEFGGGRLARISSVIWLLFGLNFVGYALELLGRHAFPAALPFVGDYRYTPWYLKFFFFQQEPVALGILLAIVYVLVRPWPGGLGRAPLVLLGLLMCDLAIVYPILMPAAASVVGAQVALAMFSRLRRHVFLPGAPIFGLVGVLIASGLLTLANTKFVTVDVAGPTVELAPPWFMTAKAVSGVVVLLPLLVGLFVVARRQLRILEAPTVVLSLGALGSYFLYVVFQLPGYGAEYKFMLTAAVCLAPFPSLALESVWNRLGRAAVPAVAVLTLVLAAPLVRKVQQDFPWTPAQGLERTAPQVELNGFDLRLASTEPMAGLVDAVRRDTTTDTLVIAAHADLHLPTLTARSMYAPPTQQLPHPGVNITSINMLEEAKRYSTALIDRRASNLQALFDASDPRECARALDDMRALNRPLAIILEDNRDAGLSKWLAERNEGGPLYHGDGRTVWLIPRPTELERSEISMIKQRASD